jgi:hypothetical protein
MYDVALDHRKNNFSLLKLAGTKHREGRQAIIKLFQNLNKRKQRDSQCRQLRIKNCNGDHALKFA